MHLYILIFLTIACVGILPATNGYNVVCYWTNWSIYKPALVKQEVKDIDASLCTHMIYSFANITTDGLLTSQDNWSDLKTGLNNYNNFNDLKKKNPALKTLLAVGGWTAGSEPFTKVVASVTSRKKFIINAIQFLKQYNFDGLDLDWEYPADRGSPPQDKQRFSQFCKELKEAFEEDFRRTGRSRLLLSAAVATNKYTVDKAYDIPEISKYLDFINLMTYDFHGTWGKIADHNSPLYPRANQSPNENTLNVQFAVDYWITKGAPASKLIMGIPLYGRNFIVDGQNRYPGSSSSKAGPPGPYTNAAGTMSYFELCLEIIKPGWIRLFDEESQVPYAYNGNHWLSYDDPKSVGIKADYIKSRGLGGAMFWSQDQDDVNNLCKNGKNPLIRSLKDKLKGGPNPVSPNVDSKPQNSYYYFHCYQEGYFRDPNSCSRYIRCLSNGAGGFTRYVFDCAPGLYYDEYNNYCNYPHLVPCW